jgi:oligosaccharyltransferase complex subunit gamma
LELSGFDAAPLAQVISRSTPIPIPYTEPIDWIRLSVTAIAALGTILVLRFISPLVQNKWAWATITMITMLVMNSGFMYSRIRGVPYTGPNGQWIAAGYQNQFGQEVHVIAFICVSPPASVYFANSPHV